MILPKMAVRIPFLVEIPVIWVEGEGHAGSVDPCIGMPAISFPVASDIGACGCNGGNY